MKYLINFFKPRFNVQQIPRICQNQTALFKDYIITESRSDYRKPSLIKQNISNL